MKKLKITLIILGVALVLVGGLLALNTGNGKQLYLQVTGNWPFWDLETVPLHGSKLPVTYGVTDSDLTVLVIRQEGLFGFGDAAGNILLKPQFQDARPFCEGLAAVEKGGRWGYIDQSGKTVIPFLFSDASDFHGSRAFVATEYTVRGRGQFPLCSVINREGQVVRDRTDVSCILSYNDGAYLVMPGNSLLPQFVDSNGDTIIANVKGDETIPVWGCSEGMYLCRWRKDSECFFVNTEDGVVLTGDFGDSTGFSDGLAAVYSEENKGWGYIDHIGAYIIEPQFDYAEPFSEGLAWVRDKENHQYHVIDKTGKAVCDAPPGQMNRGIFSEGLCMMQSVHDEPDGNQYMMHWGFMDATGKMVIPCQYQETSGFHNGIAQVWIDGKMGYIDKAGKYIWDPQ